MANYSQLKTAIADVIKTNGTQAITGQILQDVLNSIVSVIGANYTFAGVATPATNPGTPDQNVVYLAMEGGTYTNFNGTVLPAGISLLMWNGTWTSETVMYGDGGVFDISVYKSSGGTLAKYADLAAALDGGNNIPVGVRKGGMSVKFVQTSDNKYVQYRLMSDTFNTTVANWQGVDDVPTAGSNNLVKSGGIFESISDLKENLGELIFLLRDFSPSGFIPANDRAIALTTREILDKFGEYIVTPNTGYSICIIMGNSDLRTNNPDTYISWSTESKDMLSLAIYANYGVVIKKTSGSNIDKSELGGLVSVVKKEKADNIHFERSDILLSENVQSAINELCVKSLNDGIIFSLNDFSNSGLIPSTNRAFAEISKEYLSNYEQYIVVPNAGYKVALVWSDSHFINSFGGVIFGYRDTYVDMLSQPNHEYYGIVIKKTNDADISESEFDNFVTITTGRNVSIQDNIAYIATSGNDSYDGSADNPVKTIARALSISDRVIIKEGQYDGFNLNLSSIKNRDVRIQAEKGKRVILMNRHIYANTNNQGTQTSGYSNIYQISTTNKPSSWLYQHLVADLNTAITVQGSHPAQKGSHYRCDSTIIRNAATDYPVLSNALNFMEQEAGVNRYYFYYDETNHILYFTRPQAPSDAHPVCCSANLCISGTNNGNTLRVSGIDFYYGSVDLINVNDSEFADCTSKYSDGWGAFHWKDCKNLVLRRCEAAANCFGKYGDGFNGDSTIMTVDPYSVSVRLEDCWSHDNHDDGFSDHNGCNSNIIGGLYEYNRKGGVTPAAGAHCTVIGATARNNINGFYYTVRNDDDGIAGNAVFVSCEAHDNEYSGFRCDYVTNNAKCINCVSYNNVSYGFYGIINASNCKVYNNGADKNNDVTVVPLTTLS